MSELAAQRGLTRRALSQQFKQYFAREASWRPPAQVRVLVLDGMYVHGRSLVTLIALTEQGQACWRFAPWESAQTWGTLLSLLPRPQVVVCDGQKGMLKEINARWPGVALQRCHFHIAKLARRHLTLHPKTEAGQEMQILIRALPRTKNLRAAQTWRRAYEAWEARYVSLLVERTYYDDGIRRRWWYTHRNLRGVRSLIRGALPHLFTHLRYQGTPNTTNHLEGGVHAQIAETLRLHRGLRIHQKKTLVSVFLAERNRTKKATRKFS